MTRPRVRAADAAWALGFGAFLAFAGGAVATPPDPLSQLLVAGVLLPVVVPVTYRVVVRARHHRERGASRILVLYFVAATVAGTLAAAAAGLLLPGWSPLTTAVRATAYVAAALAVAWLLTGRE